MVFFDVATRKILAYNTDLYKKIVTSIFSIQKRCLLLYRHLFYYSEFYLFPQTRFLSFKGNKVHFCYKSPKKFLGFNGVFNESQVKTALTYLAQSSLVHIIGWDIATYPSCNVHFCKITISAVRAFPDQFSFIIHNFNFSRITAYLTIITFCI